MMTCAERMRRIRVMENMERAYNNGSNRVTKTNDGEINYLDRNGNVLIKASMKKVETQ